MNCQSGLHLELVSVFRIANSFLGQKESDEQEE
jgi:hypothetical protein